MFWIIILVLFVSVILSINYCSKLLSFLLVIIFIIVTIDGVFYGEYLESQYKNYSYQLIIVEEKIYEYEHYLDKDNYTYVEKETYAALKENETYLEDKANEAMHKYKILMMLGVPSKEELKDEEITD